MKVKLETMLKLNAFIVVSFIILSIGSLFRLFLTADGNFLFNMDSARDFVDVREMIELKKLRLTGPSTAIEGLYNGPAWYYLLAIGYILSGGDPYSAIVLQIVLWAIGGFCLLKLVSRWGHWLMFPIGALWVASNYIVLANLYSFNPTPVTLLSPLLIYLLVIYLEQKKAIHIISAWILAGLFFNFEMNFGVFVPFIIVLSIILTKNTRLLKEKSFFLGIAFFLLALLPQVIFDVKHGFIMSKGLLRHLSENGNLEASLLTRFLSVSTSFYNTFLPTVMNQKFLGLILLGISVPLFFKYLKAKKKDVLVTVSLLLIVIPFLGYLILPVAVNPWHLGAEMVVSLILIGYLLKYLMQGNLFSKAISSVVSMVIIWFGLGNIINFFVNDYGKPSLDPSLYKNEIAAIDYAYQTAKGQNFKAYTYIPSIYDYPYQYLFWWYGRKKYGYLPKDYAYAPDKTPYIANKEKFSSGLDSLRQRQDSNLVFLLKEPNRKYTRFGWEGEFVNLVSVSKQMVGPIEVEVKKEN